MAVVKSQRLNLPPEGWAKINSRLITLGPPTLLAVAAWIVFLQYQPFRRPLISDPGIFAYISQLVAEGLAPHKYAFNEQASLAFLVGGAAMFVGERLGVHPLIAFRLASLGVAVAVVVLTYAVGHVFTRSRAAAFLAGAIMLGFAGYGERAATALEPKSLMLLLGLTALYLAARGRWFGAGVAAGAAGLAWQIGWGYLLVLLWLGGAGFESAHTLARTGGRVRVVGRVMVGALLAFGLYTCYFVVHGAWVEMLQQTFIAPLIMHHPASRPLGEQLLKLGRTYVRAFGGHVVFGVLAVLGWLTCATGSPRASIGYYFLQNPRTAGVYLASLGFFISALLDFQNSPDWFPLLPFISIFAAWFIWRGWTGSLVRLATLLQRVRGFASGLTNAQVENLCSDRQRRADAHPRLDGQYARRGIGSAVGSRMFRRARRWNLVLVPPVLVLGLSVLSAFAASNSQCTFCAITWQVQQQVAAELNQRLPPDAPLFILGRAELLFFMKRYNVNEYIYLFGDADAGADAFEPGGFEGMFRQVQQARPVLWVTARLTPKKFARRANFDLIRRESRHYTRLKNCPLVGRGAFFVRTDLAEALFPAGAPGCLRR